MWTTFEGVEYHEYLWYGGAIPVVYVHVHGLIARCVRHAPSFPRAVVKPSRPAFAKAAAASHTTYHGVLVIYREEGSSLHPDKFLLWWMTIMQERACPQFAVRQVWTALYMNIYYLYLFLLFVTLPSPLFPRNESVVARGQTNPPL